MNIELLKIIKSISETNKNSKYAAQQRLDMIMKPKNSLGILEKILIKLAGIYGYPLKNLEKKCHIIAAADNGIIAENVSTCPEEYTKLVTEAMLNNIAAIGIMAKQLNIELEVIDIGIKSKILTPYYNLHDLSIRRGTNNFFIEPAMSLSETELVIIKGINFIENKVKDFNNIIFSNGEMGIGNTTTSSAVLYSLTKGDIDKIVGKGSGLNNQELKNKKHIIISSVNKYKTFEMDPINILSHVGGFDIAFMVGLYLGAAKYKKLMLVDGFISATAALVAYRLQPLIKDYILFTHKSEEPGMDIILKEFGDDAFLNMNMRLGEGTGAVLTYPIIECAIELINNMKTPEEVYNLFY